MLNRIFFLKNKSFFLLIVFVFFVLSSCSCFDCFIEYENFHQGNCFLEKDVKKIKLGMNKVDVVNILGNALIKDFFNKNIWYYVHFKKNKYNKINQKKIILFFNKKNVLINIKR